MKWNFQEIRKQLLMEKFNVFYTVQRTYFNLVLFFPLHIVKTS